MKKFAVNIILLLIIPFLFSSAKETAVKPLQFGTLPAESAIPIIIAEEKGFFQNAGVEVDLVPFNSPDDRNIAVQAGKIDGVIADVMTALSFYEAGFPMTVTSDINEDFKLLTSPKSGIDTFEKLNHKDISIVPNYVLEYIMDKMAEKNGIQYKIVAIPSISARFEALLADKISAVVFTEPQATLLVSRGAKVLASSKEYGLKAGTILFNKKILDTRPDDIKAFYKAYNLSIEYISKTDPALYGDILKKYGFPDAVKNYLGKAVYQKAGKITADSFQSVLEWTKSKGLIKKDFKPEEVCDYQFIE